MNTSRQAHRWRAVLVRAALLLVSASVVGVAVPARAEYPEKPIRAVIPFAPGGSSDVLARIFAQYLGSAFGQSVVADNRPGAAGNIGIQIVAASKPDGYTMLFSGIATTQNPAMYRNMPYDPLKDIQPVALLGESQFLVAVNTARIPATTLPQFVDLARKNPGKFNAAAGGIGSRLSVEVFRLQNDLEVVIVPYNSAGLAVNSLASGETDFAIVDAVALLAPIAAGSVRALAVTGPHRIPPLPNVPTTTEAGFPNYQESAHFGAYVPAATPPEIVRKLNAKLNEIAGMPEVRDRLAALGWTAVQKPPEEFTAYYRSEIAKWKDTVKRANIPPLD